MKERKGIDSERRAGEEDHKGNGGRRNLNRNILWENYIFSKILKIIEIYVFA